MITVTVAIIMTAETEGGKTTLPWAIGVLNPMIMVAVVGL